MIKTQRKSVSYDKVVAFIALFLLLIFGTLTFLYFQEVTFLQSDPDTLIWLLNANLVILLVLIVLAVKRIVGLWKGRKRELAGSHLYVRLIYIFSLLAAVPSIVMTISSVLFFHFGVQTWFSERVRTAIDNSTSVAQAYLQEHTQVIRADTLAMASDLDRQATLIFADEAMLNKVIQTQSLIRNLSEAIIFEKTGRVLARSALTFALEHEELPEYIIDQADTGDVVITTAPTEDRVRALVKLKNFENTYLYVGRLIDPEVLGYLASTQKASDEYTALKQRYSKLQITAILIFIVIGLGLVLAAIWLGLILARQLVHPIAGMITMADRVRAGDFTARINYQKKIKEFDHLATSLNRMTAQIAEQQNDLIEVNRKLDRRRIYNESILKGVSAGIIGVNSEGKINLSNSIASDVLDTKTKLEGKNIAEVLPEVMDLLNKAHKNPDKTTQGNVDIKNRHYLVRIVIEVLEEKDVGAILTFDDLTDFYAIQRKAAWSDVARRIAHEVKNPLTPIQLSAERLQRKYLPQIKEDQDIFKQCTDMIVKHVGDIERMISEFSDFARMPEPKMKQANLLDLANAALSFNKQAHENINFSIHNDKRANYETKIDTQQIRQAVNNLLQNAIDSVLEKSEMEKNFKPKVQMIVSKNKKYFCIAINDNGLGLPKTQDETKLTDPYVTHKKSGTGLGLSIVQKTMEDHHGEILFKVPDWVKKKKIWNDLGGATVCLVLPTTTP